MSSINGSITRVRAKLLKPKDQAPPVELIFGEVLEEYQNVYNELANSHVPWTKGDVIVNLASGTGDYAVSENQSIGQILFVTAQSPGSQFSYPVEFTGLSAASESWYYWYPPVPDETNAFNPAQSFGYGAAFYRKDGRLRVRVGTNVHANSILTVTFAVGNWTENASPDQIAVLTQYHHLPEIRAAQNLIEPSEWRDPVFDAIRKKNLAVSLTSQENRVYDQFKIAKRSLTADKITRRITTGNSYPWVR